MLYVILTGCQEMSVLQSGGHDAQHYRVLRHGASRSGIDSTERQQDHVGNHPRTYGRHHVQTQQHEIQGTGDFLCH